MKTRILTIALIIALGVGTFAVTTANSLSIENEYQSYVNAAVEYAKNDIPFMAITNFNKAFEIKNDDEVVYKAFLTECEKLGPEFYDSAVKNYPLLFPSSVEARELLCNYYYEAESYSNVIKEASKAREDGVANENIRDMYNDCAYRFRYIQRRLEYAGSYIGNTALVRRDGIYGYINENGSFKIMPKFEDASPMLGQFASAKMDGKWSMINGLGYTVARPSVNVEELSFLSNGLVRFKLNGKYGYTSNSMTIPEEGSFDYCSNFKNGIAVVCNNGKWAIISSDGNRLTDYEFEDVILDEFETCINSGILFLKKNGKYYMYDKEINRISENGFDNAVLFNEGDYAAVCVEDKWGFADKNGTIVIQPMYEDARSFSVGLAPVKISDKWGAISTSNELRIEPQFDDCKGFSQNGVCAVKNEDEWSYIKLYAYYE